MSLLRRLYDRVCEIDPLDLTLSLSLVLLLVRPGSSEHWILVMASTILAMMGVMHFPLAKKPGFWWVLAALHLFFNNFYNWEFSDNHKFLTSYWCVALAVALQQPDPGKAIAETGRWLVGLVFLWATLWKATSLSYLDGSVFHYLLLIDDRFFALGHMLGGLTPEVAESNQRVWLAMGVRNPTIQLDSPESLGPLVAFLTWWTILIEAAIAALFLIPGKGKWILARHGVLLAFVITTYPPTNVIHFGWMILIMALAHCPATLPRVRFVYLLTFFFIFCFSSGYFRQLYASWMGFGG